VFRVLSETGRCFKDAAAMMEKLNRMWVKSEQNLNYDAMYSENKTRVLKP
jgi:hypothetical protein